MSYVDAQATLKNCMNVIVLDKKISKKVESIWKKYKKTIKHMK